MDIQGLWKIKESQQIKWEGDTLKQIWRTAEDIMQDTSIEEDDYLKQMLPSEFLFDESEVKIIMPLPKDCTKEEIDEAVAQGEITLYGDDKMIVETHPWKEENGKLYFDTGAKGEVFGEPVSPWAEIPETEDGIQFMTYRLVKAE